MQSDAGRMNPLAEIESSSVRYIKLGEGGGWARAAIERNELPLGYMEVPQVIAQQDRDAVRDFLVGLPQYAAKASDHARQIHDFYNLDENCIWITFENDHLWWTRASKEVVWLGNQDGNYGARVRRCIGSWSNRDLKGSELVASRLSTKLTSVAAFRSTICNVKARDYLMRRIAGSEEPLVAKANSLRSELMVVMEEAIASLHWADFETLVDLVFARSGWNRVSVLGGTKKDVDLELENPVTAERAFVQVKSTADQRVLDDYIDRYEQAGTYQRMFFVCHTPRGALTAHDRSDIIVWRPDSFAAAVMRSGLQDWLFEKLA